MASPGNRHCANCIGTRSFRMTIAVETCLALTRGVRRRKVRSLQREVRSCVSPQSLRHCESDRYASSNANLRICNMDSARARENAIDHRLSVSVHRSINSFNIVNCPHVRCMRRFHRRTTGARHPAVPLSRNNLGQVAHTHVCFCHQAV